MCWSYNCLDAFLNAPVDFSSMDSFLVSVGAIPGISPVCWVVKTVGSAYVDWGKATCYGVYYVSYSGVQLCLDAGKCVISCIWGLGAL